MDKEKESVIDNIVRRYMAKNLDTNTRINNIILHKINYYYELESKRVEESNEELLSFIDEQLERLKKEILKLTYNNYKNVIIEDEVFDFLYKTYGSNEDAVKILDDMKRETSKLKR